MHLGVNVPSFGPGTDPATQRAAEVLGAATPAGARFGVAAEFLLLADASLGQVMEQWQQNQDERNAGHRS
ncbi:hypothetical protein [Nonomuraea sp. NPDC049709]|uniref:hypothetical protein n=1 Tax=Nonomuraea sp. NPDC049709 TaxID=3154736 RepID=UPI00343BCD79